MHAGDWKSVAGSCAPGGIERAPNSGGTGLFGPASPSRECNRTGNDAGDQANAGRRSGGSPSPKAPPLPHTGGSWRTPIRISEKAAGAFHRGRFLQDWGRGQAESLFIADGSCETGVGGVA